MTTNRPTSAQVRALTYAAAHAKGFAPTDTHRTVVSNLLNRGWAILVPAFETTGIAPNALQITDAGRAAIGAPVADDAADDAATLVANDQAALDADAAVGAAIMAAETADGAPRLLAIGTRVRVDDGRTGTVVAGSVWTVSVAEGRDPGDRVVALDVTGERTVWDRRFLTVLPDDGARFTVTLSPRGSISQLDDVTIPGQDTYAVDAYRAAYSATGGSMLSVMVRPEITPADDQADDQAPVGDATPRTLAVAHPDALVRGNQYPNRSESIDVPAGTAVSTLPHPVPGFVSVVGETAGRPFLFVVRADMLDAYAPVVPAGVLAEARGWLADCGLPTGGDDAAVVARVSREYDGGWPSYVGDTAVLDDAPGVAAETAAAPSTWVRSAQRTEFLSDVLCAALEGGIGYWSAAADIVRTPDDSLLGWHYSAVTLWESADDIDECSVADGPCQGHRVTLDDVARAIGRISRTKRDACPADGGFAYRYVTAVRDASIENDAGEVDADVADIVVQVAALGSVVYG